MAKVTSKNDSSASSVLDTSAEAFKKAFTDHIHHTLARNEKTVAEHEKFLAVAYAVRDRLIDRWIQTQETYYNNDVKRVYYLSLEFLIGRTLGNSVLNLDVEGAVNEALHELSMDLEELREQEVDAGLGNGGLGRLAACFLDSMATLELPATWAWVFDTSMVCSIKKFKMVNRENILITGYAYLTHGKSLALQTHYVFLSTVMLSAGLMKKGKLNNR